MREQATVTRVYDFEFRSCSARHEAAPHKIADGRVPGAGLKWRRNSRWRSKSSVSRARRFPSIHRRKVLIFGISSGTVYSVGWRRHESRRKAGPADVPGRRRPGGFAAPASAHQRRGRPSSPEHPASAAPAWHPDVAAPHSHDQRVQLQLSLLPYAARSAHAPHLAQTGRAGAHLSWRHISGDGAKDYSSPPAFPGARSRSWTI